MLPVIEPTDLQIDTAIHILVMHEPCFHQVSRWINLVTDKVSFTCSICKEKYHNQFQPFSYCKSWDAISNAETTTMGKYGKAVYARALAKILDVFEDAELPTYGGLWEGIGECIVASPRQRALAVLHCYNIDPTKEIE